MRKFQINKYGMLCATIMLVILIASCSRQGSDKQIDRISVVPSQTNENQVSYAEGQRQRVQEILKKNGVAILHEPPRKNLDSPIVKLSSGVCFDTSKLPEGWYVANVRYLGRFPSSEDGFQLAVRSDIVGIPYYKVTVPKDVDYEFVTPGQEYLTVFVQEISEDNRLHRSKISEENFSPPQAIPYNRMKLYQVDGWNFKIYQTVLCPHCDDEPYAMPSHIVDFERNAHVKLKLSDAHWQQEEWNSRYRPTAGFFNAPKLEGKYLHSSELFTAKFFSSARATLKTPKIFSKIDNVLTTLIIDCQE